MDEFVSLSGDFLLERKRLSEALRRLEGLLIAPQVADQLGKETVIDLQSEIDRLSSGIYRLETLAKTLSARLQVDKYVASRELLLELSESAKIAAKKYGKKISVVQSGADIKSDRTRMAVIKNVLIQMIDVMTEFSVESERERNLRGKKTEAVFQLAIKRKDESIQLSLLTDGNGIVPPLSKEIGESLARFGCRVEFSGKPGKWSCWLIYVPHYGPMMQCYRIVAGGNTLYMPATAVVSESVDSSTVIGASDEIKVVSLTKAIECKTIARSQLADSVSNYVCIHAGSEQVYLQVDAQPIREEVFVKPVAENLTGYGRYMGVAIETQSVAHSLKPVLNPSFVVYGGLL